MSAYDKAMKAMAAQQSNAAGAGVKEESAASPPAPVSPASATATGPPKSPVTTTTTTSRNADTENDAGMSVYDKYMQQQRQAAEIPSAENMISPEITAPDFVESAFNDDTTTLPDFMGSTFSNDASGSTQETNELPEANTWTSSAVPDAILPEYALPPEEPEIVGATADIPSSPPPASSFEPLPYQPPAAPPGQPPPAPVSGTASYASFMDALAPNSEKRKPATVGVSTPPPPPPPPPPMQDMNPPVVSQPEIPQQSWEPPLSFGEETTVEPQEQEPALYVEQEALYVEQEFQEPVQATEPVTPLPEPTAQTFAPLIPPPATNTDDPIARMAKAAAADSPPPSLDSNSFMSTVWDESQDKPSVLKDPLKFLKGVFGAKEETRRFQTTSPDIVKAGISKRIFESLDSDPK